MAFAAADAFAQRRGGTELGLQRIQPGDFSPLAIGRALDIPAAKDTLLHPRRIGHKGPTGRAKQKPTRGVAQLG